MRTFVQRMCNTHLLMRNYCVEIKQIQCHICNYVILFLGFAVANLDCWFATFNVYVANISISFFTGYWLCFNAGGNPQSSTIGGALRVSPRIKTKSVAHFLFRTRDNKNIFFTQIDRWSGREEKSFLLYFAYVF